MPLSAQDLTNSLENLRLYLAQRNVGSLSYINQKNCGLFRIVSVEKPCGPITFRRWRSDKGQTFDKKKKNESISRQMLQRVANAIEPGVPINLDRILGASYNSRAVLESALAYLPDFAVCYPGRVMPAGDGSKVKKGHKHLLYNPSAPNQMGKIVEVQVDCVISEIPSQAAVYETIEIPEAFLDKVKKDQIEAVRRHAQMQIALLEIGKSFGCKTFIAKNDLGLQYKGRKLAELDGVIPDLAGVQLIKSVPGAAESGQLIDCIWFKNGEGIKGMPAVFEVEHSTRVTPGLNRMLTFKRNAPDLNTKWLIVADDSKRDRVFQECNLDQFRELDALYVPYSAVEEFYSLCSRRRLRNLPVALFEFFSERTVSR